MTLETRALPGATVTHIDEDRHRVEARVLRYHVSDTFGTVWKPGCMADSFRAESNGPVICAFHDMSRPIGKVLDHRDTDDALELTIQLADVDAVPDARAAYSLLRDGVVRNWSVGFSRTKWDPVPEAQRSDFGEHPAKEFMHAARLAEVSMVAHGSVPGTATLAIRADEGPLTITIEDIERQFNSKLLDRHEARAMLAALSPEHRLHIVIGASAPVVPIEERTEPKDEEPDPEPDPVAAALVEASARKAEIIADAVTEKGTRATSMAAPSMTDDDPDDGDASSLAAATDAALDSAVYWFGKVDLSTLPDEIQQGIALTQAAGVAVDELLDAMGVDDPDDDMDNTSGRSDSAETLETDPADAAAEAREDPETEERALTLSTKPWSDFSQSDYTPAQWKASCLIWSGSDTDKSSGSLPVKEPDGTVNKAALAAAAARLGQVDASDADKTAAARKLMSLYAQAKLKAPPSLLQAARSVEDPEVREMAVELELDDLDDLFSRHGIAAA